MSHASILVALDPSTMESEIEDAIKHQMEPFDENDEWIRDGSRWDWWQIGGRFSGRLRGRDYIRRREVDLDMMRLDQLERFRKHYAEYEKELAGRPDFKHGEFIYGVKMGETLEQYLERNVKNPFPSFYGFLRNRVWQETERMGWFGGSFKTECEIGGADVHICVYENKEMGSKIVSWQGSESFKDKFYERFIEALEPDVWLVTVDYHV